MFKRFPGLAQIESFHNLRRQFRQYGFTWALTEDGLAEFRHPLFLQGHPDLVKDVVTRRRSSAVTKVEDNSRPQKPVSKKARKEEGDVKAVKKRGEDAAGPNKAGQTTAKAKVINDAQLKGSDSPPAGPAAALPAGFRCPYAHLHVPPYPPFPGMHRTWSPPTPGSPPDVAGKMPSGSPPGSSPPRWVMAPYGYPPLYPPWMPFQHGPLPTPHYGFLGYPEARPVEPPTEVFPEGRRVSPVPDPIPTVVQGPPAVATPNYLGVVASPTPANGAGDHAVKPVQMFYHDGVVKSEVVARSSVARVIRLPQAMSSTSSRPQMPVPGPPVQPAPPRVPSHVIRIPAASRSPPPAPTLDSDHWSAGTGAVEPDQTKSSEVYI